jgi:hypothetical protein
MQQIAHEHANEKSQRGHDLKIEQGLAADPADFLQILHAGDARDDGAENDDRDHHGDQADEAIAERLHLDRGRRPEVAVEDREGYPDQHLAP